MKILNVQNSYQNIQQYLEIPGKFDMNSDNLIFLGIFENFL